MMRLKLSLLLAAACFAGAAHAQQQPPVAASLTNPGPGADRAGLNVPAPGRSGPSFGKFSGEAASGVIAKVCESGQGVAQAASALGLTPSDMPESVKWALPGDARVWRIDSTDSAVFLYAYGSGPERCGAAISRPLAGATLHGVKTALTAQGRNYVVDSEQAAFIRFRSANGRFIDVQEFPATEERAGLVKAELLPK